MNDRGFAILLLTVGLLSFLVFGFPMIAALTNDTGLQRLAAAVSNFTLVAFCGTLVSFIGGLGFIRVFFRFSMNNHFLAIVWGLTGLYIAVSVFVGTGLEAVLRTWLPRNLSHTICNGLDFLLKISGFFPIIHEGAKGEIPWPPMVLPLPR